MIDPPDLWDGALLRLAGEVPPFALEALLRPLRPSGSAGVLRLLCPSEFHRVRVKRYLPEIHRCLEDPNEAPIDVTLAVDPDQPAAEPKRNDTDGRSEGANPTARPEAAQLVRAFPASPARETAYSTTAFQPALPYSFDSFVVGPCNALAREASLALARGRQGAVSPLYLAAETGLGKTHLACSIAREARRQGAKGVVYVSAEAFTSQLIASIQSRSTDTFKRRFRKECQLLILEDVQFLAGKTATQLEFFHTLQHLRSVGRPVVLTGDRIPRDIERLDPRTASLMTSGLVAEIEAPNLTVRRDILRAKAAAGGVRLPDACLERLVESVHGSVRDLEGALTQLISSSILLRQPIDLALTEAALRKVSPVLPGRKLEPEEVARSVARFFGTSVDALAKRSRRRDIHLPRRLAMYLCHRYTGASLSEIGRLLGRKHSSVRNAIASVERDILERAPLRYKLEELTTRLEAERLQPRMG